jgi:GTP-binding protein Era
VNGAPAAGFRSGFVSLVGRPNVGKSTLVNRLVGAKVAIVSDRPQTTRTQIRGVRTTPTSQIVLLDTPGIHKPRTMLGERTNARASATLEEVDVVCLLIEANAPIGRGDRFIAELVQQVATPKVLVVNKVDVARRADIAAHLAQGAGELGEFDAYVPLSGRTGEGVDALVEEFEARLPEGPVYYPDGVVTDQPETFLAAELLREQLLRVARDELPHSITVVVEEIEPDDDAGPAPAGDDPARGAGKEADDLLRLRARVLVERESQKGMVIGRGGVVLKEAGTRARQELEALLGTRVYLQTVVSVERDWQRRAHALDRLGF